MYSSSCLFDVVPLYMTEEDALDDISFTQELMGYVDGFEAHNMPIRRIVEEEQQQINNRN